MKHHLPAHDLAYCGLFGAAALLLPVVFHILHIGHVFMPMYLPLVALAFFVPPLPAAVTALVVPVLSGAVTGMPPFYPPVAVFMSLELAAMAAIIAAVVRRRPRVNEWLVLAPVLLFGRALYIGLVYAFSLLIDLPAKFMAGLSLLAGWPGVVLMLVVVPPVAGLRPGRRSGRAAAERAGGSRGKNGGSVEAKAAYFDGIAAKWDGWEDLPALAGKLAAGLEEFGLRPNEAVLDVGCGTGNLTLALLERLSPEGRITAVDISQRMLDEARAKIGDPRVRWCVADVLRLPSPAASFDRVFCYSVWPHIDDKQAAVEALARVLRPGGRLHIWHLVSREKINAVHASVGKPIGRDTLPPAKETAALLAEHGFTIETVVDDGERYVVSAVRGTGAERRTAEE